MNIVNYLSVSFGADPEIFLSKRGKIIGSEKIIPEGGVMGKNVFSIKPLVIRDGVQVEFNVPPNTCRQSFSNNLALCFKTLKECMKWSGTKVVFDQTVEVTPNEMQSLHPKSQQFGCAPSENAYGKEEIAITDASQYFYRSAGGHIHIGAPNIYISNPKRVIIIMDILLGNTCVLLDRSPGNIERRKVYGKAGEYRMPEHGIEYRVLSNFWLRSYQLMSFVLGMARLSVSVAYNKKIADELIALVDLNKIRYAINNNDYETALENFNAIKGFIRDIVPAVPRNREYDANTDPVYPLEGYRMDAFVYFMQKGLDHWFTHDIMKHWVNHNYSDRDGWESFLTKTVKPEMEQGAITLPIEELTLVK